MIRAVELKMWVGGLTKNVCMCSHRRTRQRGTSSSRLHCVVTPTGPATSRDVIKSDVPVRAFGDVTGDDVSRTCVGPRSSISVVSSAALASEGQ